MSGSTPPFFIERFQLPNGAAMSGGKMYFFVAGSTTVPKNVFADYALTIPLTQPLVLDAAGNTPQYFMESGLYKILLNDSTDVLQYTRDQIEGATSGSGTSALFQDSDTIHWTTVTSGGLTYNVGTVQASAILDHKVLTDATTGDVPGYLVAKFVDAAGNPLLANGSHQLVLPFLRTDTGGTVLGNVLLAGQLSVAGNVALATAPGSTLLVPGASTLGQTLIDSLSLAGIASQMLAVDGAGHVYGMAVPTSDHKVLYDISDAIPGFLGVKVVAGSGIQINVTTDGTNGKVMHFNLNPANIGTSLIRSYLQSIVLSSTATTIINKIGGIGNTISANSLSVGDMIKIRVSSYAASGVTSGFGVAFALNGTLIVGTNYVSNISFVQEYDIIITSIGPSGTYVANAAVFSQGLMGVNNSGTSSIDTTVANTFDVIASTSGTATLNQVIITMEKN